MTTTTNSTTARYEFRLNGDGTRQGAPATVVRTDDSVVVGYYVLADEATAAAEALNNLTPGSCPLPDGRPALLLNLSRPNRYGGNCRVCARFVPGDCGYLTRRSDGRWQTQHVSVHACRAAVLAANAEAAADAANEATDVLSSTSRPERGAAFVVPATPSHRGHVDVDGDLFRVLRVSYRRYGGWYLNVWTGDGWAFWSSSHGLARQAQGNSPRAITPAQAAAFGAAYSRCCFCGRDLDTAESISAGYGPTCAARFGLPWGTTTDAGTARAANRPAPRVRVVETASGCVCRACGEECATAAEAADQAMHDCVAVSRVA